MVTLRQIMTAGETILVLASVIGIIFGAIAYLDAKHADSITLEAVKVKALKNEVQLRSDMLDESIDDDNKVLYYYRNTEANRELAPAEASRKAYIEESLERDYRKQEYYQDKLDEFDAESN